MPAPALRIIMRDRLDADVAERQPAIVEIDEVGPVFLDQIHLPGQPVAGEGGVGRRHVLEPLAVAASCQAFIAAMLPIPSGGTKLGPV